MDIKSLQRKPSIMSRFAHPTRCLKCLSTLARACHEGRYRATFNEPVSGRFQKDVRFLANDKVLVMESIGLSKASTDKKKNHNPCCLIHFNPRLPRLKSH